jgi:N-acetylneuraminate synthase
MYIIGEIGSNFNNMEQAEQLISGLKKAGADAAKFQWIDHKKLYGFEPDSNINGIWGKINDYFKERAKKIHHLSKGDVKFLHSLCRRHNIDFMCSVFDPSDVKFLDPLVSFHKVASCEITHRELLETLSKVATKKILVSTGCAFDEDIEYAVAVLGEDRIRLMACDSAYPSTKLDITNVVALRQRFGVPVGVSDHSLDILTIPYCSKWYVNASFYEKHVKLDTKCKSADADHSITLADFAIMVKRIKDGATHSEQRIPKDILKLHKRRAIAIRQIYPDDKLHYGGNYDWCRVPYDPERFAQASLPYDEAIYAHNGEIEGHVCVKNVKAGRSIPRSSVRE